MSNIKQLGIPKTIGKLKEMIKDYPDNTSFEFRNQPRQELIEVNESVCFHELQDSSIIYSLGLHENTMLDGGINIMRVPGGWIYDNWDIENDRSKQGVFVPLNKF